VQHMQEVPSIIGFFLITLLSRVEMRRCWEYTDQLGVPVRHDDGNNSSVGWHKAKLLVLLRDFASPTFDSFD